MLKLLLILHHLAILIHRLFRGFGYSSSRNTLNDHFDHALLPLPHQLKSILSLLKLEPVCDEPLDIDLATGNQIHSSRVATNGIPDRAPNVQVTDTSSRDREDDVLRESVS